MTINTNDFASRAIALATFCVPFALNVLAASSEPYWLDSPEFTAAAQTLGLPHPPGHPLYVMAVKPFTLLPFGGIGFRVSLASAFYGALASLLLFRIGAMLVRVAAPRLPSWMADSVTGCSVMILSVAPGWWFQCVRAEVYSMQALLVLGFVYPMFYVGLGKGDELSRVRSLFVAAFVAGLGMTNHHYIMLTVVPIAIPAIVARSRQSGGGVAAVRLTGMLVGVGSVGMLPYAFLPIRSLVGPAISLGATHSLSDFFWVVSARVYQKSMIRHHDDVLAERSIDSLFTVMGQLGPVVTVVSLAGLYFLFRMRRTRLCAVMLALLVGVPLLLRSVMGFDPFNPDYFGYILPAMAGLSLGFAVFAAVVIDFLRSSFRWGPIIASALIVGLISIWVVRGREHRQRVDLSSFKATRLLLDMTTADAATGSMFLASYYKLFFVLWSAPYIDGSRPDLTTVNPHLLGYPGYLESTLRSNPLLTSLARSMLVEGELTEGALADISWRRDLRTEPEPYLNENVIRYMTPNGVAYTTTPEPLSRSDVEAAAEGHFLKWEKFYEALENGWQESETRRMLSWCHYQDAIFFARRGDRKSAMKAVEMGLTLNPQSDQMVGLAGALEDGESGPVDVQLFLPGEPGKTKR